MISARITIVGEIDVKEPDGEIYAHSKAMLLEFDTVADLRQAMTDGQVSIALFDKKQ